MYLVFSTNHRSVYARTLEGMTVPTLGRDITREVGDPAGIIVP